MAIPTMGVVSSGFTVLLAVLLAVIWGLKSLSYNQSVVWAQMLHEKRK